MADIEPAFARDTETARYYEQRASEYDQWYESTGLFALRDRPGWADDVSAVVSLLRELPPARTIDLACGTGYLSQHLPGTVVTVDQSPSMVRLARSRTGQSLALVGDALGVPVVDDSFERVFTGHFYGHLAGAERRAFLAEASRLAPELVVVDSARRPGVDAEQWQERVLNDGSRHRVYKRYLTATQLASEIGGQVIHDGYWFVAARARRHGPA